MKIAEYRIVVAINDSDVTSQELDKAAEWIDCLDLASTYKQITEQRIKDVPRVYKDIVGDIVPKIAVQVFD
jgi:hypothetical protein